MLDVSFRGYGLPDGLPPALRQAVASTPRHHFVHRFRIGDGPLRDNDADPDPNLPDIYSDAVMRHVDTAGDLLPSSNSQPSYVLFLLHLLGLERGQTVLEIGSGSGWLAAVMARLVGPHGRVTGIELIANLAAQSRADLTAAGLSNVEIIAGDGTRGYAPGTPYDRAIITAATWDVPAALLDQVADGGRILIPIELRTGDGCDVTVLRKQGAIFVAEQSVPGWFVPLRGDSQDSRAKAAIALPTSDPTARHCLPLGVSGFGGPAVAARLFRAFLSRTEPGFVAVASSTETGWSPGMPLPHISRAGVPPFGIAAADGSLAIWQAGEVVSYGGRSAANRLAQAYERWAALGLPAGGAFRLQIHRSNDAASVTGSACVDPRGETLLAWRLPSTVSNWRDLLKPTQETPTPEEHD